MANQKSATAKRARSKRDDKKQADRGTSQNGNGNEAATYEQELAHYLQERIKPGLNRGPSRSWPGPSPRKSLIGDLTRTPT